VISREEVEKKVSNYLGKSQALEDYLQRAIAPEQLQAEMERIARDTKQPDVLREIFAALGDDAFVIAECLGRPALAGRFSANLTAVAGVPAAPRNSFASGTAAFTQNRIRIIANVDNAQYKLPEISAPLDCIQDNWTAIPTANAPEAREDHTAVWTGSEMIIWGGQLFVRPFFEHRRQIQSRYRQLDAHEHHLRT
jgi:hypothetical protein